MLKLGIMISGRGSNMAAILAAIQAGQLQAEVALVISNKPTAKGLEIAQHYGVPTRVSTDEIEMVRALQDAGVDWVVLAGYMRIVGPSLLRAFPNRLLNIHPSLLPDFKGLHAQRQALEAGVSRSGCTTHLVIEQLDSGQILKQAEVPILPGDTEDTLSERILVQEHRILVETLKEIAYNFKPK